MEAARQYGEIIDPPFPSLDSDLCEEDSVGIGDKYLEEIMQYEPATMMWQGGFMLSYSVIKRLIVQGVTVVAACTERKSVEAIRLDGIVEKKSLFEFVQFREYR